MKHLPASQLVPNAKNWREHPDEQRAALRGLLNEIGFAGAELCYHSDRNGGKLTLIDGELRRALAQDAEVPCLITDLDDAEADKLLALLDPVAGMATANAAKLDALLGEIDTEDAALASLMAELASGIGDEDDDDGGGALEDLDPQAPPAMAWVLIGIPTVRYGEISAAVELIAEVEGVVLETTVTDA